MRLYKLLFISLLTLNQLNAQEFFQTEVDFTIKITDKNLTGYLTFNKYKDSVNYFHMKYDVNTQPFDSIIFLKNQVDLIAKNWNLAKDSLPIHLRSIDIGYPLEYEDLLINHIHVFLNSEKWQNFIQSNTNSYKYRPDYELIEEIMLENNSYQLVYELFDKFGYNITGISIEKVGYLRKEDFQYLDEFKNRDEEKLKIVPIPYIVNLIVKHID